MGGINLGGMGAAFHSGSLDLQGGSGLDFSAGVGAGAFDLNTSMGMPVGSNIGDFDMGASMGMSVGGNIGGVAAGGGNDAGGGDVLMPDDPWEQLFGQAPRML